MVGVYTPLEMEMYDEIKHYLKSIFGTESQTDFINTEYQVVMKMIIEAKTLADLFNARAKLIEFNEMVKEANSPDWAKNKVKFLEARWNKQYRLWKIRG
jgi:hypothetical protein